MGIIRFQAGPPIDAASWPEWKRAYLGGIDGCVFPAAPDLHGDTLTFQREGSESVRLHVAYPVPNFGRPVLSTASLRGRDEPYLLSLELARGRLGQLRDQLAAWQLAGMMIPSEAETALREAHTAFFQAVCSQDTPDAASVAADAAIESALVASERLTEAYVRQRLTVRRHRTSHLPILLGCALGPMRPGGSWERPFTTAFTATSAAIEWRNVELSQGEYEWTVPDEQVAFAERERLVVAGGPLLDFGPCGLPDWLGEWGHDYFSLQCFVSDFIETAITRYAGRIRFWEIAARANTGGGLALDEEHRLALTARAIEVAKQTDDELQLSLRVERPWGEYQSSGQQRLSPLQFVDALVRSGVGLSSITLELAVGYRPGGSDYRDRFEVMRLLDVWASFGLPLTISLAFPSQGRRDEHACDEILVADPQWKTTWGEPAQSEWLVEILPALMAKTSVTGIEWCHFSDGEPHRFPHGGLMTAHGAVKPSLERLTRFRQSYWRRDRHAG